MTEEQQADIASRQGKLINIEAIKVSHLFQLPIALS
jgi:hypothetical protein